MCSILSAVGGLHWTLYHPLSGIYHKTNSNSHVASNLNSPDTLLQHSLTTQILRSISCKRNTPAQHHSKHSRFLQFQTPTSSLQHQPSTQSTNPDSRTDKPLPHIFLRFAGLDCATYSRPLITLACSGSISWPIPVPNLPPPAFTTSVHLLLSCTLIPALPTLGVGTSLFFGAL